MTITYSNRHHLAGRGPAFNREEDRAGPAGALRMQAAAAGRAYAGRDRRADERVPDHGVPRAYRRAGDRPPLAQRGADAQSAGKMPDSPLPGIEKTGVLRYNTAVKRLDTTRWRA